MRYLLVCLLIAAIPVPLAIIEVLFQITGSGLSIFDTRGVGQVTMLASILLSVLAFAVFVARDRLIPFLRLYTREWRTALKGFVVFLLVTWALVIVGYIGVALAGRVAWSSEAWEAMTPRMVERTFVALLVVLVLATAEELMFRVFLMRYLRWNTSAIVTIGAVVFSSLVFAAAHNLENPLEWFSAEHFPLFFGLFLLGVLLCVTYLVTGSFWCAVAVHSGFLGSKVFLRRTELLDVQTGSWWLANDDLRMSPIVWGLFGGMALVVYLLRARINPRFAVEKPVVSSARYPPAA